MPEHDHYLLYYLYINLDPHIGFAVFSCQAAKGRITMDLIQEDRMDSLPEKFRSYVQNGKGAYKEL